MRWQQMNNWIKRDPNLLNCPCCGKIASTGCFIVEHMRNANLYGTHELE